MDETSIKKLQILAPFLNCLTQIPEADCSYDPLSGGLIWADETPDLTALPPGTMEGLRGILWYRTALILGDVNERDGIRWPEMHNLFPSWTGHEMTEQAKASWIEAQRLFPNWPGFALERRSTHLREKCLELKSAAANQIDNLFDP